MSAGDGDGEGAWDEALRAHVYSARYRPNNADAARVILATAVPLAALYGALAMAGPWMGAKLAIGGGSAPLSSVAAMVVTFTLLVLARAALFVRSFMLLHDAGHGALFPSPALNRGATWALSFLVLTPADWPAKHRRHHGAAGNLAAQDAPWSDTVFVTSAERAAMAPLPRALMDAGRYPPVFFVLAPALVWFFRYRMPVQLDTFSGRLAWAPHNVVNTLGAALWMAGVYHLAGPLALACELLAAYVGAAVGLALFHVQHAYNPADAEGATAESAAGKRAYGVRENWSARDAGLKGSSHLLVPGALARYVTLGIEYHHIHHFKTSLPCYKLRACHDEAPEGLWDGVTELGARGVWSALWNTRYNESTGLYE